MQGHVRRVVTGHDAGGKALVVSDGAAPFVHINPQRPDNSSTDVWRTDATPAIIKSRPDEPTLGERRQLPTGNGTVVRINRFAPETDAIRNMSPEDAKAALAALGNEAASTFADNGRHPLMHRTETIDYAIVLSGEITMLLDDSEVHLKAGDVLVQCGTNHAWSNRSTDFCEIAFILIDGKFDADLEECLGSAE
ncbi:MAG: cupin domain-containing protein [Rhodospirillaceae bacterium]|jgi:mannose-6-phosphate isomerase-like protein (cupin superfamily)|nr:cupin domain-containing protein [Rhodospirillaceae bacterium]